MADRLSIIIGAQDNTALPLDRLKAKLDELSKKVATARANVDDEAAILALDRMALKLDSIDRRVASPKIDLRGAARAMVDIEGVSLALDGLGKKASGASSSGGWMSKLWGGFSKFGTSISGLLSSIPGVGGALAGVVTPSVAAGAALAVVAVALGEIALALGPVLMGLGVVAVGIAGFAALAIPEVTKVWGAVEKGGKAWDKLTPAQKAVGDKLKELKGQFADVARAIQPEVLQAFGTGLDILKQVMPALEPVIVAAGKALDGFLKRIENWLKSPSGKKFLNWLQTEGPHAMSMFANAVWDLVKVIGTVIYWWKRLGDDVISFAAKQLPYVIQELKLVAEAAKWMTDLVLTQFGAIIHGAAAAFGWVPKIGPKLKSAAASFDGLKKSVDNTFNAGIAKLGQWQTTLANLPKKVHIEGDITDLQTKLAIAKSELKDPNLTKTRKAQVKAQIGQLQTAINNARAALDAINGKTVNTYVRAIYTSSGQPANGLRAQAHGGVTGAETGGPRSGVTLVGEHGPELVSLSPGSRVFSNPDTRRMLAGGGGPARVVLEIVDDGSDVAGFLREILRKHIRVRYAGSVAAALGS